MLDLRFSQRPTLDGRKAQGAPGGSSDLQRAPDLREERRVRATEVRLGRRVAGVHREQPGDGNQVHEGDKAEHLEACLVKKLKLEELFHFKINLSEPKAECAFEIKG